jgi:hypothetical protein
VNVAWSIVLIVAVTGAAVGVMLLLRRRAPDGGYFSDGDRAAGVFGALATSFSVLLAFVVFLAFTSYDKAKSGAEREATNVVQQFETAQFLPEEAAARLGGELVCYGRAVVHVEWPQLEHGRTPLFNPWGLPLFRTLQPVDPDTAAEQAAYAKWLDQTSDREQARLDRIQGGQGVIPAPLWFILIVSAGIVLLYLFFFADRGERKVAQGLFAATVTAMLATSLLVVGFLDNPYRPGSGSLRPNAMERGLALIEEATQALGLDVPVPCDAEGRPAAAG